MAHSNLGATAIRGLKWTTLASIITTFLQVAYTSVMARLLTPADFGLVAMSAVVLRFGGYFAQMGMGQALIQKKEVSAEDIRVAFTSTFFLGLFFSGLFFALAPLATIIFDNPKIIPIVRVMSLSFFLSGLSSTSMTILRKKMDFKILSIVEVSSYLFSYISVGVILAYLGFGYWSIVLAGLSQIVFSAIISYAIVRHNLIFLFEWKYYKPLLSFGSKVSLISMLEFLRSNLDTLVVGRIFSASILGIYNRAFELISLPVYYLTNNFSKVLFPAFSIIQDDRKKMRNAFLTSIALVGYILVPICYGVSAAAEQLVLTLLGIKWTESIAVLSILAIGMPFRVYTNISGIICEATATLNIKAIFQVIYIALLATLYFLLREYGIVGIAISFVIAEFCLITAYVVVTKKLLVYTVLDFLKAVIPGILTGGITGIGIHGIALLLKSYAISSALILIIQIITGGLLVILLLFLRPNKPVKLEIHKRLSHSSAESSTTSPMGKIMRRIVKFLE